MNKLSVSMQADVECLTLNTSFAIKTFKVQSLIGGLNIERTICTQLSYEEFDYIHKYFEELIKILEA